MESEQEQGLGSSPPIVSLKVVEAMMDPIRCASAATYNEEDEAIYSDDTPSLL
jgi:hypothetical protein